MIIYKTTNKINGKWYIGRDSKNSKNYYGSGKALKNAIKKYGKENFKKVILEKLPDNSTIEDLIKAETKWIQNTDAAKNKKSYNIKDNGEDGWTSEGLAERYKNPKLRAEAANRMFKLWEDPEFVKARSESAKAMWDDPEYVDIMMQAIENRNETTEKRRVDGLLKQKAKIFAVYKAVKTGRRCFTYYTKGERVGLWHNQSTCAEELNIKQSGISAVLLGRQQQYRGYIFVYIEEK